MSAPGGVSVQQGGIQVLPQPLLKVSSDASPQWPTWDWHSVRELLLSEAKPTGHLRYHINAIRHAPKLYEEHVRYMITQKVHLGWTPVQKARILAASFSVKGEKTLTKYLLKTEGLMTLAEVLRACQWLDSPRAIRQLRSKIAKLSLQQEKDAASVKDATINKLRSNLANLEAEIINNDDEAFRTPARGKGRRYVPATPGSVGLSGNKLLMIKKWALSIPAPTLSFFLLAFPKEPWQLLADLVHFSPKDFQLPFFLENVFGKEAPEGTMVHLAATATKANLAERLEAERGLCACYSFFRTHFKEKRVAQQSLDEAIAGVMAMGFSRKEALIAKQHFPYQHNATEAMVEWIFEHGNMIAASADPVEQAAAEDNQDLTNAAKAAFGKYAPLEDVLWYFEELDCPEVQTAVQTRLAAGEQLNPNSHRSAYGKLMERILLCRKKNVRFWKLLVPLANKRLQDMKEVKANIEQAVASIRSNSVAVDGSASSSSAAAAPASAAAKASEEKVVEKAEESEDKNLISMLADAAVAAPTSEAAMSALTALTATSTGSKDGSKREACKIAVFGDASGSMEVAIQSASSLGALLSAVLDAELSFFNSASFKPPVQPRSADDTLRVIDSTEARDNTSMAAALYPYYKEKKKMDLLILVSDEGENAAYEGEMFASLFRKYKAEVNPQVKLFLVSFLPNDPAIIGTIKERLNHIGLGDEVSQVRFDISRPDTSKFDNLLATLSLELELIRQRKKELKDLLVVQHGLPNVLLDIVTEY